MLRDALAAKEWGLTPSQFRKLPEIDQVEIIAVQRTLGRMSEWENYQAELKAKPKKRNG